MEEIWKDVVGYEGYYQVSSLGRVRSLDRYLRGRVGMRLVKGKIKKPYKGKNGYYVVTLGRPAIPISIHRLVAKAFIPNPYNLPCVNHKDENKLNNNVDNLEWCDMQYNLKYGTAEERRIKKLSKQVYQYDKDLNFIKLWKSAKEIERFYGYSSGSINNCCIGGYYSKKRGKWVNISQHKGYIWSYTPLKKEEPKAPPVQLEFDFT